LSLIPNVMVARLAKFDRSEIMYVRRPTLVTMINQSYCAFFNVMSFFKSLCAAIDNTALMLHYPTDYSATNVPVRNTAIGNDVCGCDDVGHAVVNQRRSCIHVG